MKLAAKYIKKGAALTEVGQRVDHLGDALIAKQRIDGPARPVAQLIFLGGLLRGLRDPPPEVRNSRVVCHRVPYCLSAPRRLWENACQF